MKSHSSKRMLGPALVAVAAISCTPLSPPVTSPQPVECQPTVAYMTPPADAIEAFARGSSSPDAARVQLRAASWLGNDAMWIILPPGGEIVGRLDDKIPPYRVLRGHVQYAAKQLDGPGIVGGRPIGTDAYGDIGFAAGGPAFPTPGCWAVTYTLDGAHPLEFVLRVR